MKKIILISVCLVYFSNSASSQNISKQLADNSEVGERYIYEFRDGTTIIGDFIKDEEGNIYITDLEGKETYIPRVMIAQVHVANNERVKNGEYWFPNLHDSRYFFSPSGFGLEKVKGILVIHIGCYGKPKLVLLIKFQLVQEQVLWAFPLV